eukprot:15211.XXX_1475098_1475639_1 [CDS] Oithona nana genome sequencing.
MGAITSKGRSKKAVSKDENNKDERNRIPSLIVTQAGSEPPDEALEVDPVGGGAKDMTVNEELRRVIEDGRREIKEAQEKLNSSLTTPIVESEAKVIEEGNWLSEVKDLNKRFNALPPISMNKKIKDNAMAFTVD